MQTYRVGELTDRVSLDADNLAPIPRPGVSSEIRRQCNSAQHVSTEKNCWYQINMQTSVYIASPSASRVMLLNCF